MDPEVWVHQYDLENKRVAPETPEVINFGRPSQAMAGGSSSAGPSSSTPTAPVLSNPAGAEPVLRTPAAPTPSRATTGDSQLLEEKRTQFSKSPRAAGLHVKKVATKPAVKQASASSAQAKDKSPAPKDSSIPAEKSTPEKDHPLDDY